MFHPNVIECCTKDLLFLIVFHMSVFVFLTFESAFD